MYLEIDFEKQLSLVFWIKSINFVIANKKLPIEDVVIRKTLIFRCLLKSLKLLGKRGGGGVLGRPTPRVVGPIGRFGKQRPRVETTLGA